MKVKPIPNRIIRIIKSQLERSVCKIYINEENCGTGFLCKIPFPDEFTFLPVLITNNHVINEEYFQNNKIIIISFDDDKKYNVLEDISIRKFYSNENYDISIIELFPKKDNLKQFLELDLNYNYDKNDNEETQNIYLLHYLNGNESNFSSGNIIDIKGYEIKHTCSTDNGSSGGPILLLETNKVIGIHKGSGKNKEEPNYATLLKELINEFNKLYNEKFEGKYNKKLEEKINEKCEEKSDEKSEEKSNEKSEEKSNEIIIKLKIEKKDINKDVYILNYPYYINSEGKRNE